MKIFTTTPSIFNDHFFLVARELTLDDFIMSEPELIPTPKTANDFKWTPYVTYNTTFTLKEEIVQELNEYEYYKSFGSKDINTFDEKRRKECTEWVVKTGKGINLDTGNGGKVRKLESKLERAQEALISLEEKMKDKPYITYHVETNVARINDKIKRIVDDHNSREEDSVVKVLTQRDKFQEIIDLNEELFQRKHNLPKFNNIISSVDEMIASLNEQIGELEQRKAQAYLELSEEAFIGKVDDLPEDVKAKIDSIKEEGKAFGVSSERGLFFV